MPMDFREENCMSDSTLPDDIRDWIGTIAGRPTRLKRQAGGNRRQAWEVDVDNEALFLRFDPINVADSGDPYTIRREARIYQALRDTPVLLPRLIGMHPDQEAMLVERAPGSAAYTRIADVARKQDLLLQYMRELARLHAVDATAIDHGLGTVRAVAEHIQDDLAVWEAMYRQTGRGDPLIEFGLAWLRANIPTVEVPAVIVHGDAGPGNFLFRDGKVTALLDWELAHLGDPIEDLAWVSMRSVIEPVPDFAAAVAAYVEARGYSVDRARLHFHRVFVQWRVAIIRHRLRGADLANSLMSRALNRRLLVEALAAVTGQPMAGPASDGDAPTARTPLFDNILDMLRDDVLPALAGAGALPAAKAKSVARIVKHLRALDRSGVALEATERAELSALLGAACDDVVAGRQAPAGAVRGERGGGAARFRYLGAQSARETLLMRDSMGALASRSFPALS